jgi:hypothetical protein
METGFYLDSGAVKGPELPRNGGSHPEANLASSFPKGALPHIPIPITLRCFRDEESENKKEVKKGETPALQKGEGETTFPVPLSPRPGPPPVETRPAWEQQELVVGGGYRVLHTHRHRGRSARG